MLTRAISKSRCISSQALSKHRVLYPLSQLCELHTKSPRNGLREVKCWSWALQPTIMSFSSYPIA